MAYQNSQNLLDPDDPIKFPEVKRMFRLTLSNNALGWYDEEEANWTTFDQVKQAFLKRFNIWGDTHCQQQILGINCILIWQKMILILLLLI